MSTVVVVQKDDLIAIGADTVSKYGDLKLQDRYRSGGSKILQFGENRIALVGATVHLDVLRSVLRRYSDRVSFESREAIFDTYVALHPILKEEYFVNPAAGKDDDYEPSQIEGLIANPNGIFGMFSWRTVVQYRRFFSIGSGRGYALGAMHAIYDQLPADKIVAAGLAAACEFDDSTEAPVEIYTMAVREPAKTAAASQSS